MCGNYVHIVRHNAAHRDIRGGVKCEVVDELIVSSTGAVVPNCRVTYTNLRFAIPTSNVILMYSKYHRKHSQKGVCGKYTTYWSLVFVL